jgi:HD-like signal output (HDOD) protein
MIASPEVSTRTAAIGREIDTARQRGPLQQITVPPCPELLTRLQRTMADAEPDLNEMGRIATADVAMAATLIRNANGARFAGDAPVVSTGQALYRLGLRESAAIMTGFLARHAMPVRSAQLDRFWERSSRRALGMGFIAGQLAGVSADLAYSYGLFCHVGMPVLMQSVRGYGATMVEGLARKDRSFVATENANHRTDHAVVGALTARVWRLAPAVVAAIRLHHDLQSLGSSDTEPELHTLVAAGLVADHIVQRHEGLPADIDWLSHGDAALDWLQASHDDLLYWEEQIRPLLDTE